MSENDPTVAVTVEIKVSQMFRLTDTSKSEDVSKDKLVQMALDLFFSNYDEVFKR